MDEIFENFTDEEILQEITNRYSVEEINDQYDDEALRYDIAQRFAFADLVDLYDSDEILEELKDDDISDYLIDAGYFVRRDEDEAINDLKESRKLVTGIDLADYGNTMFRQSDCIERINEITQREGWDYLYELLEKR